MLKYEKQNVKEWLIEQSLFSTSIGNNFSYYSETLNYIETLEQKIKDLQKTLAELHEDVKIERKIAFHFQELYENLIENQKQ